MLLRWLSLLHLISPILCSVEFFTSDLVDTCAKNGHSVPCNRNTARGGMCAYAPDANKLWCCPAPDPTCWSWGEICTGTSGAAGADQIPCSADGSTWCCIAAYEYCSKVSNQVNVCLTKFDSPQKGVPIDVANSREATSMSSLTSTPSGSSSASSSASSRSSTSAPKSEPSPTATVSSATHGGSQSPTTAAGAASTTSSSLASAPRSSLCASRIAGVVIGSVAATMAFMGDLCFG